MNRGGGAERWRRFGNEPRADYTLTRLDPQTVVMVDRNRGGRSLTNDVNRVLDAERAAGRIRESDVVVYRDSEGMFDGVRLDGTIYAIQEPDLAAALLRAHGKAK